MSRILVLSLCLACAVLAMAQPDPNAPPPPDPRFEMALMMLRIVDRIPPVCKSTPVGLFMAQHGVLTKYDAIYHRFVGSLELFGPCAEWPEQQQILGDQGIAFLAERTRRLMTPAMEIYGNDLLLVAGGQYFRIDGNTLQVKVTAQVIDPHPLLQVVKTLRQPNGLAAAGNPMAFFAVTQLAVEKDTLYIISDNARLFGVDIATGKVISQDSLPETLTKRVILPAKDGPFAEIVEPDGPVADKPFAVIGRLMTYKDDSGLHAFVQTLQGEAFTLQGKAADVLLKDIPGQGPQVLVLGTYRKTIVAIPDTRVKTVAGALEVTGLTELQTAVAAGK